MLGCAKKPFNSSPVLQYVKMEERSEQTSDKSPAEDNARHILKKIASLKVKFHHDRKLMVKHLPRNVMKQEIAQLLGEFCIESIHLSSNDDKSSTALVSLKDPEVLDDWNFDRAFLLRGQSVSVSPTPTEMVLCVARLPFYFTETNFYDLVKSYGDVKMYFLMISEKSGSSKGYGFVQYTSKENALAARNALNDKIVDSFQLVCDWLDSSHLTFKSLHSTCLYVDKLPRNFRDMGEFRAIFEKIVRPPYCQIALRNGCPLNWGLVEYLSSDDAELAQISCNNYCLRNQPIRVVYYIPGVRAITLMLSLLDTPARGKSTGLLPDPTGQSIRMSIENLSKQNPIFAENLKNIILHQIHETKHVKENPTEGKPNGIKDKVIDAPVVKNGTKDMERIIPPTPPMTPTIVNAIPIMSPATVPSVPLLPNTAVPPPVLEKLPYNQPLPVKDKFPVMWNDVLGQTIPNGSFAGVPTLTAESAPAAFAVRHAPIATNLVQEVMNLPLNVQQNIISLINSPPNVAVSMPQVTVPPPVAFSPLTVDPHWILQKPVEPFISAPIAQSVMTLPICSEAVLPSSWPSMAFVQPANVPVFTTAGFHNMRVPQPVFASQPTTPVVQYMGQKRKLLPSPEKSPEGNYIGQHSQGLGGHYADSYFKKKKMF